MIHPTAFSLKKGMAVLVLMMAVAACDRGPRFPTELSFQGSRLEQATVWSAGKISGVVFVPPGEKMELASLQLGIIVSREHASGVALHDWIMEQYHHSPTAQWYESTTAEEACKVGLVDGPRPFVALHVCRSASGVAACAESDERLDNEVVGRCLNRSSDCWDELCNQKWDSKRAALEAEVLRVLGSQ